MKSSARIVRSLVVLSAAMLTWAACNPEPGGGNGTQGGSGGSSTTTTTSGTNSGGGGTGGAAAVPLFETDIIPIFEKSCGATTAGCHAPPAYAANSAFDCRGWLALTNEPLGSVFYDGPDVGKSTGCPDMPLYDRLLKLAAWQECNGAQKKYIVPCDVDASYLFDKIDDGPYCGEAPGSPSEAMPKGKLMDPVEKETIRAWILAGAPRVDGTVTICGVASSSSSSGSSTGSGMTDQTPQAQINHPGDKEQRAAGVAIPFIGVASDPQDGTLSGASMVWTSDISGQIGTGTNFDAPLPAGTHTITLKATDSDGNSGTDSITLYIQ